MSCIIAKKTKNGGVVVVGDSCVSNSYSQGTLASPKIFIPNDSTKCIIGVVGGVRVLNLLANNTLIDIETENSYTFDLKWCINTLIPNILNILSDNGAVFIEQGNTLRMDNKLLIATDCGLYVVQEDFSVVEYDEDFAVIGCGEDTAKGVLNCITRIEEKVGTLLSETEKLTLALDAVSSINVGVSAPYDVLILNDEEEQDKLGDDEDEVEEEIEVPPASNKKVVKKKHFFSDLQE